MRWCFGCGAVLIATNCAGATGPVTAPPAATAREPTVPSSSARPRPPPTRPAEATTTEVVFEALAVGSPPSPPPHLEILFPFTGKTVPAAGVADYDVRLKVEHWSGRDQLALDDYRPVIVEDPSVPTPLGSLVPVDRDLATGTHRLFAVALDERDTMVHPVGPGSRQPFALVEFRVGARVPLADQRPFIAYSQPRGTYNGDQAADAVLVDFYLVEFDRYPGSRVRVDVSGIAGSWTKTLQSWHPLRVRGLPSGDFAVELTLVDRQGVPIDGVSAVARTITINRDAPLPPESGGESP